MTKKIGPIPRKEKLKRNQKIIDLYKKGKSIQKIAPLFKLTEESVRVILKNVGMSSRNTLKLRNNKIIALYKKGKSIENISKEIKLGEFSVRSVLVKSGDYVSEKSVRNKKIVDLYLHGKTMVEISKSMDVGYYTVKGVLVKNDVYKSKLLPKPLLIKRNKKIIELYKKGYNLNQIAIPLNIDRESARQVLIKHGIYKYPGLYNEEKIKRNAEIVELYNNGKTVKEISEIVKLSYYPIKNLLINKGLYVSHKLTNELAVKRNKIIFKLYKSGISPSRIAERMNLEYSSVRGILIKASLYKFNAPRDRSRNEKRNKIIVKLYESGKSLKSIAEKMDLSSVSIRDILIKQNAYKLYEYSHINDERNKRIVDMYKKGTTVYDIAEKLKVCYNTVRNALIKKHAYDYIQERTKKRFKKK